jgi:hypothetical protein
MQNRPSQDDCCAPPGDSTQGKVLGMELKIGDIYKCPEGHKAKIVWISEDKKVIAVRCPQKHFDKVAKVADYTKPTLSYNHHATKEEKIYVKNMVFLIRI